MITSKAFKHVLTSLIKENINILIKENYADPKKEYKSFI